jgi:hypothetical protein
MKKKYSMIENISFINSNTNKKEDFIKLYDSGLFENISNDKYLLQTEIKNLGETINSRLRNRMSLMSLGVYNALENGPGINIRPDEELSLFTGFGEIETTNIILKNILIEKLQHVSPTHFHNSVHHTSLGYYTIIKGMHNPCITISDGLSTNLAFIHYIQKRILINSNFTVIVGDEYSDFFKLDMNKSLNLVPVFGAYRILTDSDKGFCFNGVYQSIEDLTKTDLYKNASTIIADKETFLNLKNKIDKKLLTDYPAFLDNPCSIALRLAFPFYFDIKGTTLVLQNASDKFYCFEVIL